MLPVLPPQSILNLGDTTTLPRIDALRPSSEKQAAVVIRGNNITIDCNRAVFRGTPANVDPDQRTGIGIEIIGKNVTVKNAIVRGYKVGIIARNAPGLRLINCDVSYNWKPRLLSTPEKEDESDWMSYHQNEKDEWLRYGAGIYLNKVDKFEIKGCRATGGACGLMMMKSNQGLIWNNDFSFLSAIGVGMYRSSDNRIMHNRIDYCLRGFSNGVYNRGQDSAGILIYEQSNRNTFAYNSVTHGGDGFFLWAGQSTMDTGKGGCNDNLLYANDFSHAPTNGIEATFSRNRFINNKILECWHGVWGGYSYDTKIIGNVFGYNAEGIAIEHGQKNDITGNVFYRDDTAIHLWANAGAPDPNWGYPKNRDTKSHGYQITNNAFTGTANVALNLTRTADIWIDTNQFDGAKKVIQVGTEITGAHGVMNMISFAGEPDLIRDGKAAALVGISPDEVAILSASFQPVEAASKNDPISALNPGFTVSEEYFSRFIVKPVSWDPWKTPTILRTSSLMHDNRVAALIQLDEKDWVAPLKGGMNPFIKAGTERGWRTMFVDEWGPLDFRTPKLVGKTETTRNIEGMDGGERLRFSVVGPPGKYRLITTVGSVETSKSGEVPGFFEYVFYKGSSGLKEVVLEYTGAATTDYRGIITPAGKPIQIKWQEFRMPIAWNVKFYAWDEKLDVSDAGRHPRDPFGAKPIKVLDLDKLDFASGGAFYPGGPNDHFATKSEGVVEIPEGNYEVSLTADDGVRFYIDGKKVLDEWHYQGPTSYKIPIAPGKHKLEIEHFEIDGYAALKATIATTVSH